MNYKSILYIGRCFFLGIMCCLIFSSGVVAFPLAYDQVEAYVYDANGNRQSEVNTHLGLNRTYTHNLEDQTTQAGNIAYTYTDDDFLAKKQEGSETTTYDYSSMGELRSVTLPDGMKISYTHDALTRPVAKSIDGVVVEKYLWNGRTQLLAVLEADNSVRQRFIYADDRMPYAMTQGGQTYYLAYDQVGSLRIITDTSGNIVKEVKYDTFGNIIDDTNASFAVPFGFAGGLHDQETGLVRFGYRDYSPEIGRWTAKDPIGFAGGDTNLYGYVANSPVNWVDPTGEIAFVPAILAVWAVVEVGLTLYDIYNTADTLLDPCVSAGEKLTTVGGLALGAIAPGGGYSAAGKVSRLGSKQLDNLKRFNKKLPANAGQTKIYDLPNGGKAFQADVPAKNIPGSYATYEKQVDAAGNTLNYTKTTYAPDGSIVHVKKK